MNKSHLSQARNSHPVVTPHDVGNYVKVQGVGEGEQLIFSNLFPIPGVLRYVGPIQGKDGLFCGIELDQAIGKHNGTYQGIFWINLLCK